MQNLLMNEKDSSEAIHTPGPEHTETSPPPRRKKATRACFHCQKAHLTCDDSRPCQRCIKRDLASTCTDGLRKKAKYLQDSNYDVIPPNHQTNYIHNGFQQHPSMPDPVNVYYPPTPTNYGFGSEAVTLEYSMLNHMLDSVSNEPRNAHPTMGLANIDPVDDSWQTSPIVTPPISGQKRDSTGKRKPSFNTPESVYANVTKPFSYTEGFHYLVKWVRERMEKEHTERIVRALATFRPSFIALIMNLTEEDLTFMEKCFQRTILENEKLISFSGTPTVVWRRTGQIALVGKEFSLLTQWTREQLVGKTKYIYEVMDNRSAVEYWEKFAAHAFNNSTQSVMTTCILVNPQGEPVPCTFCFTIKRDIFDIPLAVVGNFLPILS